MKQERMIENIENIEPENGIDELLLRCLEGTANEEEYDRAWQWASQSPENRAYYRDMFDVLLVSNLNKPVDSELQKRVWARLEREIRKISRKPNRRITIFRWASAAAILIMAYMAGIHILYKEHPVEDRQLTVQTDKGQKTVVELNDGSKVWLNEETSFMYAESFGEKSREVNLAGEAYFEVAKHAEKPFIVKTDGLTIEVLGTQFNVRASENESYIKTTLIEGSVKIQKNDAEDESESIILVPGQQIQFDKQSGRTSLREVNSRLYTAWKEGQMEFDRDRMEEIFALMEQNFGMTVILKNEKLAARKFTGRFELDETPERMLALIQQSIPFKFHIKNDTIIVK